MYGHMMAKQYIVVQGIHEQQKIIAEHAILER